MLVLKPRQGPLERSILHWVLAILLIAGCVGIAWDVTVSTGTPQQSHASGAFSLNELEEALLTSQPNEYRQRLKAWQQGVDYQGFAGAVVETSRGQLLAGAGAFLDATGRHYHDHDTTERGSEVIEELGTKEIQIYNDQGKRVSGRIRLFTFSNELDR